MSVKMITEQSQPSTASATVTAKSGDFFFF